MFNMGGRRQEGYVTFLKVLEVDYIYFYSIIRLGVCELVIQQASKLAFRIRANRKRQSCTGSAKPRTLRF